MKLKNLILVGIMLAGLLLTIPVSAVIISTEQVFSPKMTSNTAPSPNISVASTEYQDGFRAWNAFDRSTATSWATTITTTTGFVQINTTDPHIVRNYTINADADYGPKTWTLKGSNDNSTFTTLDTQTSVANWGNKETRQYAVSGTTPYLIYRLDVTLNQGNTQFLIVNEFQLYETLPVPNSTYTANKTGGFAPLAVAFTDTSTNTPTSWSWKQNNLTHLSGFEFSTSQNPTYSFPAGNYTINLTATNAAGSNTSTQTIWINVTAGNSITADFTASNTTGIQPLLVQFTDTSTTTDATIDAWAWDFGDGNISALQNPSHTYEVPGTHTANLTITNTSLSLVSTKIQTVTVNKNPVADFSAFSTAGFTPFTTYLYDTSANLNAGPYSYYWDFGDGNTSTGSGALHTYNETGSFTVRHSVTDSITTRWENKTDYITVVPAVVAPTASFYGGPQLGAPPLRVFLTDVSTGSPTGWNWSMGDGTYSESQNPSHIYATSGFFTVSLTATNSAGSNTTTQSNFVMVY